MNAVYVRVQFDNTPDEVAVGGALRGELVVSPELVRRRRRLLLKVGYRVNGGGTPERRLLCERTLDAEPDASGAFRHPFEVAIPDDGPISYRGGVLEVGWRVEIEEVRPRRFNKRHVFPFRVVVTPSAQKPAD